jgi:carboxymethylenebutenolidase
VRRRPSVQCGLVFLVLGCATGLTAGAETVTYQVGRETVRAYLANQRGASDSPGLVVIHAMWGLNDQILGVVDRLSSLGYVVIAPDLYRGRVETDPGLAQELMWGLNEDRAVAIVKGAVDALRRLDGASGRRVGTLGFGMGGRVSLASALRGAEVQATVNVYGGVESNRGALASIKAPLLGMFGARDAGIPVADVKSFEAGLKEAGKDATIFIFNGVGHDFMNDRRADYDPEIAKDAWGRMQDWLAIKLRLDSGPAPGPAGP